MTLENHPAVGIDLGTTFSVVAHLEPDGRPATVLNTEGDSITPSVVLFDGSSVVVGKEALKAAPLMPDRIADFPKRDMGNPHYNRVVGGKLLPPEVIQALILEKLKRDAELSLGSIEKAVITVPAYFNEPRRKATQDAGQMAGLQVLDIINEPTAAAIAYGTRQGFLTRAGESQKAERILVYDLGGGTFDVTLMEIDGREYTTIATAGDVRLGGIDWDQRLVDFAAEQFARKYPGTDPRQNAATLQRWRREAEEVKRTLSAREQAMLTVDHEGHALRVPITRDQFESTTSDLAQRTLFTVRSVLQDAGFEWRDITRLLLVGGSTRMPGIQRMLQQESGLELDRSLSTDEAVAHGAALYAGILLSIQSIASPQTVVRNVNSHSLGVLAKERKTGLPRNSVLIPRNTPLPASNTRTFRTAKADQRSVAIHVIEGGDAAGRNATVIGDCIVRDLPENTPVGTAVDVTFTYADNGRLTIRARLPDIHREAVLRIYRQSGLNHAELDRWSEQLKTGQSPLAFRAQAEGP